MKKQNRFTKTLNQLMKQKGITQRELAKATAIPLSTINGYTGGLEPREIDKLIVIAEYFKVPIEFLVKGKDINSGTHLIDPIGIIQIVKCTSIETCPVEQLLKTANQTSCTDTRNHVLNESEDK
jgi:transcriptional regulator with XRE-family HTH domain